MRRARVGLAALLAVVLLTAGCLGNPANLGRFFDGSTHTEPNPETGTCTNNDTALCARRQHNSIADLGEGHQALDLMIAVRAPTVHSQRQIDLGRSGFAEGHGFARQHAGPGADPSEWPTISRPWGHLPVSRGRHLA